MDLDIAAKGNRERARICARIGDPVAYAPKLARLEREVNTSIDLMCDAKAEALTYISFLTGEERAVIEGYFILAKSWQRLANDLYMSERRIFMLRKSGLDKLPCGQTGRPT